MLIGILVILQEMSFCVLICFLFCLFLFGLFCSFLDVLFFLQKQNKTNELPLLQTWSWIVCKYLYVPIKTQFCPKCQLRPCCIHMTNYSSRVDQIQISQLKNVSNVVQNGLVKWFASGVSFVNKQIMTGNYWEKNFKDFGHEGKTAHHMPCFFFFFIRCKLKRKISSPVVL